MTMHEAGETHYYEAFGLVVRSSFPVVELAAAAPGRADIEIVVRDDLPRAMDHAFEQAFAEGRHLLLWRDVGSFAIVGTDRIEVRPADGVSAELVSLPLLGTVFATLLHLRGLLVLHASAIAVAGNAVAFVGDKGAGKSTTAMALVAAGHGLLSDDVVAVEGEGLRVRPAFGQVKLWPGSADAAAIAGHAAAGPLVHPAALKRRYEVERFDQTARPLRRVYALERGDRLDIVAMSRADALTTLLRQSYVARFGRAGLAAGVAAGHLALCARAVADVPVRRLIVPRDLARLGDLADRVAADTAV